ncbi:hypothetical protein Patl1_11579 [Pistacia atlantica]|uniref:Uncharacterized protein n=1 Tax=Pistacia atlantica TaxID=434234 RepID=A0ACC1A7F3_9ROSI|nr:hypothetical protein Patl1_11579 [Pistacia atlantica]
MPFLSVLVPIRLFLYKGEGEKKKSLNFEASVGATADRSHHLSVPIPSFPVILAALICLVATPSGFEVAQLRLHQPTARATHSMQNWLGLFSTALHLLDESPYPTAQGARPTQPQQVVRSYPTATLRPLRNPPTSHLCTMRQNRPLPCDEPHGASEPTSAVSRRRLLTTLAMSGAPPLNHSKRDAPPNSTSAPSHLQICGSVGFFRVMDFLWCSLYCLVSVYMVLLLSKETLTRLFGS